MDSFFASVMMFSMVLRFFLDPQNAWFNVRIMGFPAQRMTSCVGTVKFANKKDTRKTDTV